jgi:GNAT superfamily N-acetyltransferase
MELEISDYKLRPLTKQVAIKNLVELTRLANLIPFVEFSPHDILADMKGDRPLLGKWEHSLVVFDQAKPIATIYGYERRSEESVQYPANTLYIAELAVSEHYQGQGIANQLIQKFLQFNYPKGLLHLDGPLNYSVQTNAADWNDRVRKLYESFGFAVRATEQYDNRTDIVMGMKPKG